MLRAFIFFLTTYVSVPPLPSWNRPRMYQERKKHHSKLNLKWWLPLLQVEGILNSVTHPLEFSLLFSNFSVICALPFALFSQAPFSRITNYADRSSAGTCYIISLDWICTSCLGYRQRNLVSCIIGFGTQSAVHRLWLFVWPCRLF